MYVRVYIYMYIYINAEKNIFTKFIQVYTPRFLWDTLCHRGKRVKADGLHLECHSCEWRRT